MPGGPQTGSLFTFPLAVVGDEEIQMAVVVEIEPAGPDRPHLLAVQHARRTGVPCR